MSRSVMPFAADDISSLARSLKTQLSALERQPGHVELLNILARAVGFQNFQHFHAQQAALAQLAAAVPETPRDPVDMGRVKRLLRLFDGQARLLRWPPKQSQQQTCLWILWSKLPRRQVLCEAEINRLLQALHDFGDHALLRRWLCDYGMVVRTVDGSQYRRVERKPTAEALALLACLKNRPSAAPATSRRDAPAPQVRIG